MDQRLTEAVVKEIELKTPYKVVDTPNADSILSARLLVDTRHVLVENAFDQPRVSENELRAEVTPEVRTIHRLTAAFIAVAIVALAIANVPALFQAFDRAGINLYPYARPVIRTYYQGLTIHAQDDLAHVAAGLAEKAPLGRPESLRALAHHFHAHGPEGSQACGQ